MRYRQVRQRLEFCPIPTNKLAVNFCSRCGTPGEDLAVAAVGMDRGCFYCTGSSFFALGNCGGCGIESRFWGANIGGQPSVSYFDFLSRESSSMSAALVGISERGCDAARFAYSAQTS